MTSTGSGHAARFARLIDAFNARDYEDFVSGCTEDVEIESRFSRVGATDYRGIDAVATWWADLEEAWESITAEPETIVEVGPDRTGR